MLKTVPEGNGKVLQGATGQPLVSGENGCKRLYAINTKEFLDDELLDQISSCEPVRGLWNPKMDWKSEAGIVEMLFTYMAHIEKYSGWSNWRNILIDILTCHENHRRLANLEAGIPVGTATSGPTLGGSECRHTASEGTIGAVVSDVQPQVISQPYVDSDGKDQSLQAGLNATTEPTASTSVRFGCADGKASEDEEKLNEKLQAAPIKVDVKTESSLDNKLNNGQVLKERNRRHSMASADLVRTDRDHAPFERRCSDSSARSPRKTRRASDSYGKARESKSDRNEEPRRKRKKNAEPSFEECEEEGEVVTHHFFILDNAAKISNRVRIALRVQLPALNGRIRAAVAKRLGLSLDKVKIMQRAGLAPWGEPVVRICNDDDSPWTPVFYTDATGRMCPSEEVDHSMLVELQDDRNQFLMYPGRRSVLNIFWKDEEPTDLDH